MARTHTSANARAPEVTTDVRARTGLLAVVLLALALVAPAPAAGAASLEKGFWGPIRVDGVSQFPIYDDLGVTIFQTTISWADVAPTRPEDSRDPRDAAYRWPAEVDDAIREARRHRMKVLIMLTNAPAWANGGRTPEYAPDRPSDFADFARAASRRYPEVLHWMIWGEPSRSNNFKPFVKQPLGTPITAAQKRAPRRYARLLDAAYGQLKAQRRTNLVIGGNTYVTGEVRPGAWMRAMTLPDGRRPRIDLYGHNPFSFRNPSLRNPPSGQGLVDFSDLGRFGRDVQRVLGGPRRKRVRLFLSEFTIPTAVDSEFNFHVSPRTQAKWITNAFKIARGESSIVALGWIHLYDDPPDPSRPVVNGGLITHDGKKKPGYEAFKQG
ncbi:MAG: hypothetical protein H0W96_11125 [Solirubrobacterales bacterium]|nr:hypothetical protein [Solirubrobacterales bacterium]